MALALIAAATLSADDTGVPIARIDLAAAQNYVLAGRTNPLAATPYNAVGATLSGRALQWQVSDPRLASVDNNGTLRGILPGLVTVTAIDPDSGTQGAIPVYVYPGRFTVNLASSSIEVGATTAVSVQLADADGNPINGTPVTFSIADPTLATASGSTITAQAEGRTAVLASIDMGPGFDAYSASAILEVVRKADYKVTRLFSTDTPSTNLKLGVPYRVAAFGNYVASITSLSNGGQGLVLQRLGQNPKIIDSAGNAIDGTDQVIESFSSVTTNAAGDVAVLAYVPAEWCGLRLIVYRAAANWKPVVVPTNGSCNIDLQPRSLDSKGGLFYRADVNFTHWSPDGTQTVVFKYGDSVAGLKALNGYNGWGYTPFGNLAFVWVDTANLATALAWDGASKFTKIAATTSVVADRTISSIELPKEIAPGDFISRVGSTNWVGIARFKGTTASVVIGASTMGVGWIQGYFDGIGEDIFFHADYNGGTSLFHINGMNLSPPLSNFALWRDVGPLFAVSSDTVIDWAATGNAPQAVQLVKGAASTTILGPGLAVDGTAYLGLSQYALGTAINASGLIFHTSSGVVMKWTGTALIPVFKPGDTLPGGRTLSAVSTVSTSRKGDFVIIGQTQTSRAGVWASRNGVMQTLAETDGILGTGGNLSFQYTLCCDRGAAFASINSKGQIVTAFGTSISQHIFLWEAGSTVGKQVAQMSAAAPGGGNYGCCPTVRIDEGGHIAFTVGVSKGGNAAFLWDGSSVRRIIGNGDTDPMGHTVTFVYDLIAAGDRFFITAYATGLGNVVYSISASGTVETVVLPSMQTTAGLQVGNLFGPNIAANASNDLFFPTVTASGNAIVVHKTDGTDKVAAITSRKTSDGDWLLTPFPGAAADTGDSFFPAYFWSAGKVRFGVFQASPR